MKENYDNVVDDFNQGGGIPAPAPNKFDDIVDSYNLDRQVQAQALTRVGQMSDPDKTARAMELSGAMNVPQPVVENNLPEYEQRYQLQQVSNKLKNNPSLTDWLVRNPEAASISHDDFDNLNYLSQAAHSASVGFQKGQQETQLQTLYGQELLNGKNDQATADQQKLKAAIDLPDGVNGPVNEAVKSMSGFIGGLAEQAAHTKAEVAAGGVIGSAVPGAGTIAGLGAGLTAGFVKEGFITGTGAIYSQLKDATDKNGNPIDPDLVKMMSLTGGTALGALNALNIKALNKPFADMAAKFAPEIANALVTRPTIAQALSGGLKQVAKSGLEGAAFGTMAQGITEAATQGAKIADKGDWDTVMNDPAERQKVLDNIVNSAETMALTFGALHILPIASNTMIDAARAKQAGEDSTMLQNLQQGAEQSKLKNRSLNIFQSFMQDQMQGSPSENMFIPGDKIRELYQSHNIDPTEHDPLFGFVPDMKEQLAQTVETGGDVVIPTADYITHLAGTPLSESLKGDIRMRQDGMTLNEAAQWDKERTQHLEESMQNLKEQIAQQEPSEQIFNDVFSKLRNAGQTIDVANQNASIVAARYATRGARLEQNPHELYADENLNVRRQLPEQIKHIPMDNMDVLINSLRADKKLPSDKQIYGDSLVDFVKKRGGLQDAGGELKHIGAKDLKGLVRKSGQNLDDATLAAWEHGYFPEEQERPGIDSLVQAVRDELHGDKRYAGEPNALKERFRDALGGLDEALNQLGIDPKTATNEEIKAALKGGKEQEGQVFNQSAKIDTPEFKKWFGDSKVVDKDGNPVVVYHGTASDITQFIPSRGAIFFSENPEFASSYAISHAFAKEGYPDEAEPTFADANVIPAYIKLENPFDYKNPQHVKMAKDALGELPNIEEGNYNIIEDKVIPWAKKNGFDGVYLNEFKTLNYGVFSPEQIKSIFNKGTFDSNNPNILNQENRGSIQLGNEKIITLFKDADMSTFMHEMGHLWLDEMGRDALREDAPDGLRDDMKTILKWLGADSAENITTEQHEQFARGFEQYLMEGKAPSSALAQAFSKFRAWLLNIYKNVAGLDVPMNDKIRDVFSRMLATDEEIKGVQDKLNLNPIFKDAEAAGMTKAEFAAYTQLTDQARTQAQDKLLRKTMEVVRKEQTKDWQEKEFALREEMQGTVDSRPDLNAQHYLRTGKDLRNPDIEADVKLKLSKKELVNWYGSDEVLKLLPTGTYSAKEGVPADIIAEMFGYKSGDSLVDALMSLEAQRKEIEKRTGKTVGTAAHVKYLVDEAIREEMRRRHGDALTDGSIEEEALKAVHNTAQSDLMAVELRQLAKNAGHEGALSREQIESWVRGQIADMPIKRASNAGSFSRMETKAGKDAERALLKGDYQGAFEAKQKQLVNHILGKEAAKAADDFEKGQKLFKKYSKPTLKSVAQEYLNQTHALLQKVGYKVQRTPDELASALKNESLSSFVANKINDGEVMGIAQFLLSDSSLKKWDEMTLDQFRGLKEAVQIITHNGREQKAILDGENKVSFDEIKAEARAQRRQFESIKHESLYERDRQDIIGKLKRSVKAPAAFFASLVKLEDYVARLDNDKALGVYQRVLFEPLKESQHKRNIMLDAEKAEWQKIEKILPDDDNLNKKIEAPELIDKQTGKPHEFTLSQVVGIALNTGNESNFSKMLEGEGWTKENVQAVLNRTLKKEHWDLVQSIINRFEHYWPETETLYRKLNGIAPEKIKASPIETPHGTYEGGYFPIMYDALRSSEMMIKSGDKILSEPDKNSALGKDYYSAIDALTPSGRTITRTGAAYPLLYDLNMIPSKLHQTIHDLAFRESIINANKFLRSRTITTEIRERLGAEAYTQIKSAIRDIANSSNQNDKALSGLNKIFRSARLNTTMVGIYLRASTVMKHGLTALSNSQAELGAKWLGHGIARFATHPQEMRDMVYNKSPEMRYRMSQIDSDIRQSMLTLKGESGMMAAIHKFGHYGVAMSDQATAIPTWLGAYDKAISEGAGDSDAVKIADQIVRNAHGASGVTDLAAIQRASEFVKVFTPFYSFMNHVFNRGIAATSRRFKYGVEKIQEGDFSGARQDFAMVLSRTLWYFIVPGIAAHMVSHGAPSQKEDKLGWMAKAVAGEAAGTIPILRDIANYVLNGRQNVQLTPLEQMATTVSKNLARELPAAVQGNPPDKWIQHTLDTAGYVFGLPVGGQPAMSVQYLWDLKHNKVHPQNAGELMHGVVFGEHKK